MTDVDANLVSLLLDDRVRGLNYLEIEKKHGIPAAEARALVNEALSEVATKDPIEMRYIMQLRLEKIVDNLWAGLENGSFKHGEAILRAAERMAELMDLNQDTIKHQITVVSDEETPMIFNVLKNYSKELYGKVMALPLNAKAQAELEMWPEWTSEAATSAVEEVIYATVEE